jgi:hypothetical protein
VLFAIDTSNDWLSVSLQELLAQKKKEEQNKKGKTLFS